MTTTDRLREAAKHGAPSDALGRLAQHSSTDELVTALEQLGGEISGAAKRALAIELALREKPIARGHPIVRSIVRARRPDDPPPWLLPIEAKLPPFATGFGGPPAAYSRAVARPDDVRRMDPHWLRAERCTEITTDTERSALTRAVVGWESNQRIEGRVFSIEGATGDHAGEDVLRPLDLAALPAGPAVIEPLAPEEALAQLFSAAHGGAYSRAASDTHARDLAWTSFRALLGVPPHAWSEEVERLAMRCAFTQLRGTPFFWDVAWDIGLAVVSADRGRLAVLCASDSD